MMRRQRALEPDCSEDHHLTPKRIMQPAVARLAALMLLLAPASAFSLVAPRAPACARAASAVTALRMQAEEPPAADASADEAPPAEAAAAPASERTSPLAGIVGEQSLSDFQKKKDEDNAKRLALRSKINIALPGITLGCLLLANVLGFDKEKIKEMTGGGGDPFSNAPGVAEAREKKAARQAKAKAEQQEALANFRKSVNPGLAEQ